ncbi:MAG: sensor domain-containing diguanylate cyclase [Aquihabitans sp.]
MKAAIPPDDEARVATLHRYGILDQPPAPDLEAITRLATYVSGAGVGVINLIDRDRQWQAAATGMKPGEVSRDDSMCAHVVGEGERIAVADASQDPRFVDNPFVTGEIGNVRLYVGTPIKTSDGQILGSLCVVDDEPRELADHQLAALADLADQVMSLFELHHRSDRLTGVVAELDHLAAHDSLTGLANRRRFTEELDRRLGDGIGEGLVIFGDLAGFKGVNDGHGHGAGDQVLQAVAERLRTVVRPDDLVARLGGDEFAILCLDMDESDAPALMERLREAVAEPISTDAGTVAVGLSLGLATSFGAAGLDELLRQADEEMYRDKAERTTAAAR